MNEPFFIQFETTCRNCLISEGLPIRYLVLNEDINDYITVTEFQVMKKIEMWRKEEGDSCRICGSLNIEYSDIKIGDKILFDYNRITRYAQQHSDLDVIIIYLEKINNVISFDIKGKEIHNVGFAIKSFRKLIKYIESLGNDFFVKHTKGNMYSCMSQDLVTSDSIFERFYCFGFSKKEILDLLNKSLKECYAIIDNQPELCFPFISRFKFDEIYSDLLSNPDKKISMDISYFDENLNDIKGFMDGTNKGQPQIKKVSIIGIINTEYNNVVIIDEHTNKNIRIGYHVYKTPFMLGTQIKDQILISEITYNFI